ncbi:MAG: FAD:protein FMN transferase [Prevotellaceae bacterium]|nr:FAD:protein FMN transferase [Prevotellaceae bacterium]
MKETAEKKHKNSFDPYAPHKIKWWGWPLLILLIIGTIYIFRTNNIGQEYIVGQAWGNTEKQTYEGAVFGTFFHITYQSEVSLQQGIDSVLQAVDNSLSPFNEHSVITAINNNTDMTVDPMFADVFHLSIEVAVATNGAFDITVAPLVNLWGFGFKNMDNVSDEKVDSLLEYVGLDKVRIVGEKNDTARVFSYYIQKDKPQIMFDCSAIAKGYGVDAVGKYLECEGIANYMVEIGGEVRVRGVNPQGNLWRIGINKPKDDLAGVSTEIEEILQVTQLSMATSGNYRNFYEKDGKKYAHTIDPRTGTPVQHSILSSTVLAQDCATADAFATAFMVLGLDEAQKVLAAHPELMAFFIYTDKNGKTCEWHSEGLKHLIVQ